MQNFPTKTVALGNYFRTFEAQCKKLHPYRNSRLRNSKVHVLHPWTRESSLMQSSHVFIDYRTYFNHWHHSRTHFKTRELTTFAKSSYRWFDALWSQFFHMFLTFSPSVPFEIRQVCCAKYKNKSALSHCFNRWSMACSVLEWELLEDRSYILMIGSCFFHIFYSYYMGNYFAWKDRNLLVACMQLYPYVPLCRLGSWLIGQ